jgi:hypothetical protein
MDTELRNKVIFTVTISVLVFSCQALVLAVASRQETAQSAQPSAPEDPPRSLRTRLAAHHGTAGLNDVQQLAQCRVGFRSP